jgi:Ca-activated chloride channel family protein
VIFVIDTSGSMQGESISQAKTGLRHCLKMLTERDFFTIIRFASDFSAFSPDLRQAAASRVGAAGLYVDGLSADGGTEMQKAMAHALSLRRRPDAMTIVVFLTDGDVGNEDTLLALLKNNLGSARLFSFGIGSAPNEFLVRKMGELGRGQARFIRSHEDVGEVVSDFFKTLGAPVLTDVSVSWIDNVTGENAKVETYPSPCPDVFLERPLQVVAKIPSGFSGRLRVEGRQNGRAKVHEQPIPPPGGAGSRAMEALFGGEKINQLMIESMTTDDATARPKIESEVLATALDYQLLCKFTARVAVEEKVERYPDGSLKTVNVPVPVPNGWTGFAATATTDPVKALCACLIAAAGLALLVWERRGKVRCSAEEP